MAQSRQNRIKKIKREQKKRGIADTPANRSNAQRRQQRTRTRRRSSK